MFFNKKNKGFTLIELLVVISIIGILATIIIINLASAQAKSRDTQRIADLENLKGSILTYKGDHTTCPVSDNGGAQLVKDNPNVSGGDGKLNILIQQGYISSLPQDPINDWNSSHIYRYYYYGDNSYQKQGGCVVRTYLESNFSLYQDKAAENFVEPNAGFGVCLSSQPTVYCQKVD